MATPRFVSRNTTAAVPARSHAAPDQAISHDRHLVQSVLRATAILREFESAESLTVGELAARLTLPKPTISRLASTLERGGLLERNSDLSLKLGPGLVSMARLVLRRGLPATARPHLERLFRAVGHSVNLAVIDQADALYVDAIDSGDGVRMVGVVGDREPLHATALGKAIAAALSPDALDRILGQRPLRALTPKTITSRSRLEADLSRIRECGYAIDDGENVVGGRCVGAAVRDPHKVIGGISVSASASALHLDDIPYVGKLVVEAAEAISASLGIDPRPSP